MKLSEKTIKIFENFSSINQSILVKQGNKVRTISVMKNILAEAEIKEDFPRNCAIYDLKQFLNGLGLHEDPQLDFSNDNYLVIREGKRKVKYFFADENVIVTVAVFPEPITESEILIVAVGAFSFALKEIDCTAVGWFPLGSVQFLPNSRV